MCGKKTENLLKAIVEGTMLSVCEDCTSYGNVIEIKKPEIKEEPRRTLRTKVYYKEHLEEITPDFSKVIKEAREKKNFSQEDLAKAIAEKESVIHKIETNTLIPPMNTAKKLEQLLGIKLINQPNNKTDEKRTNFNLKDKNLTIGDIIKIKKSNVNKK